MPTATASVFVAASTQQITPTAMLASPKGLALTSKERQDLTGLLRKCRSIFDPSLRSIVVSDLERDFDTTIQQTRSDTLVDIRHIIDACEYFNNFASLIDAMKFFDQDAPPMLAVEKFLQTRLS